MNALHPVYGLVRACLRQLLPLRCQLCGAAGDDGCDLCTACAAELPRNAQRCARCALPLPLSAPQCGACLRRPPPFAAAWSAFRYGHPLDLLETRLKFGRDLAAGRVLAESLVRVARDDPPALPELVVCVPLHRARLRERGFNQAWELARPLARALDVPACVDLLERHRATTPQTGLGAIARRRNLRGAFRLRAGAVVPAHVAVFDDVMTTGSTLAECARVLRRAGAVRVDVWALARAPARSGGT